MLLRIFVVERFRELGFCVFLGFDGLGFDIVFGIYCVRVFWFEYGLLLLLFELVRLFFSGRFFLFIRRFKIFLSWLVCCFRFSKGLCLLGLELIFSRVFLLMNWFCSSFWVLCVIVLVVWLGIVSLVYWVVVVWELTLWFLFVILFMVIVIIWGFVVLIVFILVILVFICFKFDLCLLLNFSRGFFVEFLVFKGKLVGFLGRFCCLGRGYIWVGGILGIKYVWLFVVCVKFCCLVIFIVSFMSG